MALKPQERYPGQTTVDAAYPHGKARNQTVEDDGIGTPWEKDLVNDIFGFQQALLAAGDVNPSGDPDTADESDYLTALKKIFIVGKHFPTGAPIGVDPGSSWEGFPGGTIYGRQNSIGVNCLYIPIALAWPKPFKPFFSGLVVKSFGAYMEGVSGHAALPGNLPRVRLVNRSSVGLFVDNTNFSVTDTSASTGAYQASHWVERTGISVPLSNIDGDNTGTTMIEVRGETGSNSLIGLRVYEAYFELGLP